MEISRCDIVDSFRASGPLLIEPVRSTGIGNQYTCCKFWIAVEFQAELHKLICTIPVLAAVNYKTTMRHRLMISLQLFFCYKMSCLFVIFKVIGHRFDRLGNFAVIGSLFGHYKTLPFMFLDRKSTRLNSSHVAISYAVFCLKKKKL